MVFYINITNTVYHQERTAPREAWAVRGSAALRHQLIRSVTRLVTCGFWSADQDCHWMGGISWSTTRPGENKHLGSFRFLTGSLIRNVTKAVVQCGQMYWISWSNGSETADQQGVPLGRISWSIARGLDQLSNSVTRWAGISSIHNVTSWTRSAHQQRDHVGVDQLIRMGAGGLDQLIGSVKKA